MHIKLVTWSTGAKTLLFSRERKLPEKMSPEFRKPSTNLRLNYYMDDLNIISIASSLWGNTQPKKSIESLDAN